jgi:hypothetical protein
MPKKSVSPKKSPEKFVAEDEVYSIPYKHKEIYPSWQDKALTDFISKAAGSFDPSYQESGIGLKQHPFDFAITSQFKLYNPWHSSCITAKKNATVGLGFKSNKVEKVLDPLCEISFQDVLGDVSEGFWQTGTGYFEVVWDPARTKILGLHHLPSPAAYLYWEDTRGANKHYEVHQIGMAPSEENSETGQAQFALFGDKLLFIQRMQKTGKSADAVSEVIAIKNPTSLSRHYGMPDWLAAVAFIELVQVINQHEYDFYLNRAVPEFLLFLLGAKVSKPNWNKIVTAINSTIGYGNTKKSIAVNIPQQNLEVVLHKLGLSAEANSSYKEKLDSAAMAIVSAHQVPPLLAGILISGKLGSTNEFPNALQQFQEMVIAPAQKTFATTLANTLGNAALNGGLGLSREDFLDAENEPKFKRLTDKIDTAQADTVSRMREPLASARAKGRDISQGLKD